MGVVGGGYPSEGVEGSTLLSGWRKVRGWRGQRGVPKLGYVLHVLHNHVHIIV